MKNTLYPDFPYSANELGAYAFSIDTFMISLKQTTKIIRHECDNPQHFEQWLKANGVRDANAEIG